MNNNFGISFMAFGAGVKSTDVVVKRYTGVAPVKILAVNPNKETLEKLYNTQLEKEPEYISEVDSKDKTKKVPNVRIDFIVKTVAERCNGIDFTTKVTFFIRKEYRFNNDKTKVQIIDKYGRTAWATVEEVKAKKIPTYSSGRLASIDADYRPLYIGEEALTNFLRTYLGIPRVDRYVNGQWIMRENPSECESRLEKIDSYFKNDFSELIDIVNLQPENVVKVLFGVNSRDDKQYQTVYTDMFLNNRVEDYSKLEADLTKKKELGMYANVEFTVGNLKEYTIEPTDLSKSNNQSPFDSKEESPWDFE